MNPFESGPVARTIIADRIREADQRRLAHELKKREQTTTTLNAAEEPERQSRLWTIVHFRHALG